MIFAETKMVCLLIHSLIDSVGLIKSDRSTDSKEHSHPKTPAYFRQGQLLGRNRLQ